MLAEIIAKTLTGLIRLKCPHCGYVTGWTVWAGHDWQCGKCGEESQIPQY